MKKNTKKFTQKYFSPQYSRLKFLMCGKMWIRVENSI